ncbi:MAG: hypothetical protein ABW321_24145, partial [Polyangiales bacterium]
MSTLDEAQRNAGQRADVEPSTPARTEERQERALGRRSFMGAAGTLAVTTAVAVAVEQSFETKKARADEPEDEPRPDAPVEHVDDNPGYDPAQEQETLRESYRLRVQIARDNYRRGLPLHPNNGDDALYPNKIGSDTRGLPHNEYGEVDLAAYNALLHALETKDPADFELVPLGGTRKLAGIHGTLALSTTGLSPTQTTIPAAPTIASAEKAAEAVESYWQSLLRDVPFSEYRSDTTNELVLAATKELDGLSGYQGPRDESGRVTPELLFRGSARYVDPADPSGRSALTISPPGVNVGPYISQFIYQDIPSGVTYTPGLLRVQLPGIDNDFLATYEEWLANQDGAASTRKIAFDPVRRYLAYGRDLAEYARGGAPSFWGASQWLGTAKSSDPLIVGGGGVPFNPTNPYLKDITKVSSGSGSFNISYVQAFLPLSTSREIRANYWAKWFIHRTPRPEAIGGLVHNVLVNGADYPLHEDVLNSEAADRSFQKYGAYYISSAYPDGAPNHSSYPGGASSNAAVNATILKAFFDENHVIENPVQPDPNDPTKLIPYVGPPLTVGGELNKLATNLGLGRNWAGIHWRSDAAASLPQAEDIAIGLLRDERNTFREAFAGFKFTR